MTELSHFSRVIAVIVGLALLAGCQSAGVQPGAEVQTRTVDMHIAKLRKKLIGQPDLIETIRGEGYRYNG